MTNTWNRLPRIELKKLHQEEAAERLEKWNSLTTMQKIADLDNRLGANVGAKKES